MEGKKYLGTSNNPNEESHEKNRTKTRRSRVKTESFYIKLYIYISVFTRENSAHPAQVFLDKTLCTKLAKNLFFLAEPSLSLLVDTVDTSWSNIFNIAFFQHRNKSKARNFTTHGREASLLHTWLHAKSWNHSILLDYYSYYNFIVLSFLIR